ncbi:hypothetical protein ACSV9I_00920 [Rhizobium sp. G187]|uniref:hypothetical protein n=1 Tax=Rhizobium sp. G187 TaxID=3451352 RepID=UPI003EE6E0BD
MSDEPLSAARRYLVVVEPAASVEAVCAELSAKGFAIASRLDAIRTLVVEGGPAAAGAASHVSGVRSIEPEGWVRTQD